MNMREDIFAEYSFGKVALKKMESTDPNFRLYEAGWIGKGNPPPREVMEVSGAVFREAMSGPNKGKLAVMVPGSSRSVLVTAREMEEFEAAEAVIQ